MFERFAPFPPYILHQSARYYTCTTSSKGNPGQRKVMGYTENEEAQGTNVRALVANYFGYYCRYTQAQPLGSWLVMLQVTNNMIWLLLVGFAFAIALSNLHQASKHSSYTSSSKSKKPARRHQLVCFRVNE